jgi:hypothetical protein
MTFEEAVRQSIKKYWQGKTPEQKGPNKFKYTKKYFDKFEESTFGSKVDYLNQTGDK